MRTPHRRRLLAIVAAIPVAAMVEQGTAEDAKALPPDEWPGDFTKVLAVAYDFTQQEGTDAEYGEPHVVVAGNLHKGIFVKSKPLTKDQIKALFEAITDKEHTNNGVEKCFWPHHGFLFYDAAEKLVGSISICLTCHTKLCFPRGEFASDWKFAELEKLLTELDLPIIEGGNKAYTEAFQKSMANKAQK